MRGIGKMSAAIVAALTLTGGLTWVSIAVAGHYGWLLFAGAPTLLGFVATSFLAIGRPERFSTCMAASSIAGGVACFGFLAFGAEGLYCILMTLPLAVPLAILGSSIAFALFHARRLPGAPVSATLIALLMMALVPFEKAHSSPVYVVEDSAIVHASAERTWHTIVALSDVAPSHDLLFRGGMACPQRTKIVAGRPGGVRVCTMSTGILLERIDIWQPGQRLAWRAISTPPPMKELNPIRDADPPHLHGYYRNVRGEFAIERLGAGACRLTRRTWYSFDLYPFAYWRMWCDFGAAKIQRFVLDEIRRAAEQRRDWSRT
jgi:hypothetical protein